MVQNNHRNVKPGEAARSGHRQHRFLEALLTGQDVTSSAFDCDATEAAQVQWAAEYVRTYAGENRRILAAAKAGEYTHGLTGYERYGGSIDHLDRLGRKSILHQCGEVQCSNGRIPNWMFSRFGAIL